MDVLASFQHLVVVLVEDVLDRVEVVSAGVLVPVLGGAFEPLAPLVACLAWKVSSTRM